MDVEPLVVLESRLVPLEPLAAGLPQLTRLAIADATFTRQPWALSQLAWLSGLRGLRLAWDTGLWAPGQVLQEGEALQVRCCKVHCCCCCCWLVVVVYSCFIVLQIWLLPALASYTVLMG
jgi:hypothetical protein